MTKTFTTSDKIKRAASIAHRKARKVREIDPFCSYLFGRIDDEGQHTPAYEPDDHAVQQALRLIRHG